MANAGVPGRHRRDPRAGLLGHRPGPGRPDQGVERRSRPPTRRRSATPWAAIADISPDRVSLTDVGPTWGSQISEKAIIAVLVFFVVVVVYISFRFEWKMAMAALIAVIHDLLVTAGIYSLAGFQVTPDTVIALLTILGYSLYDTVVVFDRVKENSRGQFGAGPHDLHRHRQPVDEPDPGPVHQHLARGHPARAGRARHRRAAARGHHAAVLRPGPGHRAHLGGVLVDLHRLAGAGRAERARGPATSTSGASSRTGPKGAGLLTPRQAAVLVAGRGARRGPRRVEQRRRARRPAPDRASCGPARPTASGAGGRSTTPTTSSTTATTTPRRRPPKAKSGPAAVPTGAGGGAGAARRRAPATAASAPQGQGREEGRQAPLGRDRRSRRRLARPVGCPVGRSRQVR